VAEDLIREALHPYGDILVATKAGLARPGPNQWLPLGRPEYLIQQAYMSCRRLGVDQIGLWQLHRIDPQVPRAEQFDAIKHLIDAGVIRCAGLSEVSVADVEAASKVFKISSVQNRYNLLERTHEDVLVFCEKHGIAFIPWFPLGAGEIGKAGPLLAPIASRHRASATQIALAWLLRRSTVIMPIPGTSNISHLEENIAAVDIALSEEEYLALDRWRNIESLRDQHRRSIR
jgi:pyridoxine 4-dehydrogenase